MQRKRLLKLAEFLQNMPRRCYRRFNMKAWGRRIPQPGTAITKGYLDLDALFPHDTHSIAVDECGTAGCALGWATAVFPALSLEFYRSEYDATVVYNHPTLGKLESTDAAKAFFGLDESETEYLFYPTSYPMKWKRQENGITPKQVAQRIRGLVENYG